MKTDIYDPTDDYGRNGEDIYTRNAMRALKTRRKLVNACLQCGGPSDALDGGWVTRCEGCREKRHMRECPLAPRRRRHTRMRTQAAA